MATNIYFTLTKGVTSSQGTQPLSGSYAVAGNNAQAPDQVLGAGTDQLYSVSFGAAGSAAGDLQAIEIYSNQNLTIKTNSASTPQDTIAVTANVPILWDIQSIHPCPFAGAVTAMYVTNTVTARLQMRILTL